MKLADLATAQQLVAEHASLLALLPNVGQTVTLEINQDNKHQYTFDLDTTKRVMNNRIAQIVAELVVLGVSLS